MEKLRELSTILGNLHAALGHTVRIGRGSPCAGNLSTCMEKPQKDFNRLKPKIEEILSKNKEQSSSVIKLTMQFNQFDGIFNETVNERGNEDGYTYRVIYLERINYECGLLKGMLDIILEGIWTFPSPGN